MGISKKKKKKKRVTKVSINRGMRHPYGTLHSQYTGYHSKVVQEVVKKKIIDRKSQFLTHLGTGMKEWYSIVSKASEIELQIAVYNDKCIIIGSNKNDTATWMYNKFVEAQAGNFLTLLTIAAEEAAKRAVRSQALEARRVQRHAGKLAKELVQKRDVGLPLLKDLEKEGKDICVTFDASKDIGAAFAKFLNRTDPMDKKHVALVTASEVDAHAEQKILVALCKAALVDRSVCTAPIIVAGTFRPCRGCFESLSLVQKYCFQQLQFGSRPGHYWQTTAKAHLDIFNLLVEGKFITDTQCEDDFNDDGLLIGLTNTTHRPKLRTRDKGEIEGLHYATESESEGEDDV
jgi:hypothetical protein